MADVEARINVEPDVDLFDYEIIYELRRNGVPTGAILTLRERIANPDFANPAIQTFVPNLTFTDTSTGLPITYEIFICGQPGESGQLAGGFVNYRALNAIVFG
jgi:hypothetical protein